MTSLIATDLESLLRRARACTMCQGQIPAPNPVLRAHQDAQVLIIGQAPGTKVHASGIPWNDASGKRLRQWMEISEQDFYDPSKVAIIPMGFCYPGKGKSGDLAPRPECAPQWHDLLLQHLIKIRCTLLIGQYAQNHYLPKTAGTLTERVRAWPQFAPQHYVLPHPSPRNQLWLRRNSWFEAEVVPHLQQTLRLIFSASDAA